MLPPSSFEDHQTVAGGRPVVLVRYRSGVVGETARTVHLVPLPAAGPQSDTTVALCGARLQPEQIEMMNPGEGMPCTGCALRHTAISQTPLDRDAAVYAPPMPAPQVEDGRSTSWLAALADYRLWGWPITVRRDQIGLRVGDDPLAVMMPESLAAEVITILTVRCYPPPVLAHPYAPGHHVLLPTERYGVTLPWPAGVQPITGTVLLPPSATPRGPLTWVHRPDLTTVRSCREIDLFGALRTAQATQSKGAGR